MNLTIAKTLPAGTKFAQFSLVARGIKVVGYSTYSNHVNEQTVTREEAEEALDGLVSDGYSEAEYLRVTR